jgi:hypothetical protein
MDIGNRKYNKGKHTAQGNTLVTAFFNENPVIFGNRLGNIRQNGNLHGSKPALFPGQICPSKMGKLGIHRASNHLGAEGFKVGDPLGKGNNFRWADKGKVEGVEEEDDVFSLVVGERHGSKGAAGEESLG